MNKERREREREEGRERGADGRKGGGAVKCCRHLNSKMKDR